LWTTLGIVIGDNLGNRGGRFTMATVTVSEGGGALGRSFNNQLD
jgi:hypothetical protein